MDNWVLIVMLVAALFLLYVCYEYWRTLVEREALEQELAEVQAEVAILQKKEEIRKREKAARDAEREAELNSMKAVAPSNPNPQHLRPMYDSHGPLFNVEEPVVAVETEEVIEVGSDYRSTGEADQPESTSGAVRSGSVSDL